MFGQTVRLVKISPNLACVRASADAYIKMATHNVLWPRCLVVSLDLSGFDLLAALLAAPEFWYVWFSSYNLPEQHVLALCSER